jgi:hypothetical protein
MTACCCSGNTSWLANPLHRADDARQYAPAGRLANTHFLKRLFGPRCPCVPDVQRTPYPANRSRPQPSGQVSWLCRYPGLLAAGGNHGHDADAASSWG